MSDEQTPLPPPEPMRCPPELLAWVQQTTDVEEFMAEVHEAMETGGVSFETIYAELEAMVRRP